MEEFRNFAMRHYACEYAVVRRYVSEERISALVGNRTDFDACFDELCDMVTKSVWENITIDKVRRLMESMVLVGAISVRLGLYEYDLNDLEDFCNGELGALPV